jgi:hypothetical protein
MPKITNFLIKYKYLIFIILYLVFRVAILNINSAEWGDSYRILRATDYLKSFTYPSDEKRPPLFSALLLLSPLTDAIAGSRVIMLMLSVLILTSFYFLLKQINLSLTENQRFFSMVFLAINPLFLYWSIRIYADSLFLFLMLLSLNIFYLYQRHPQRFLLPALSFTTILAVLTRFEGYILFACLFLSIFLSVKKKFETLFYLIPFILFLFMVIYFPQFSFYKNPIGSSYVDEATGRILSLREIFNFGLQYLFILGNLYTIYFLAFSKNLIVRFFKENLVILFIVLIHSALAFVWFAAVPRLLLPLVPFLCILFVKSLETFFSETSRISTNVYLKNFWRREYLHYLTPILLLLTYLLGQAYLKLPFLLTNLVYFSLILIYSAILLPIIFYHYKKLFIVLVLIFNLVWGYMFISLEKDTLKVLNTATLYFISNYSPSGNVLTNDISSITRYYLGDKHYQTGLLGKGRDLSDTIKMYNIEYVIVTNEQNPEMSFTPSKHPYLTILKEFRQVIGGREFYTYIARVNVGLVK